ncbi:hypothetical protein NHQ30_005314 [Ciborinia camelliae]|nr:hypothetical protein NHQ30_005314 [Ciborinia camelliae]
MAAFKTRKAEMLLRLFDEDRENAEMKNATLEALKDDAFLLSVVSLSESEKEEALERVVYKKLFGDDPSSQIAEKTDDAKDAESTVEPAKDMLSESNDVANPAKSDAMVKPELSYRDQAAKTPPPPEEPVLTLYQKRRQIRLDAMKESLGPEGWHRMLEANKKTLEASLKADKIMDERNRLLPMMPGGLINQYSTFAPATWDCQNLWSAENGAQIKKLEEKLHVELKSTFEPDLYFRIWPEPADWVAFGKDPVKGKEILANAEKFVEFWIWNFLSWVHVTDIVPLLTCLDWFLVGDNFPRYKEYLKRAVIPKPQTAMEAREVFQGQAGKS